jgi:hypothetical protein
MNISYVPLRASTSKNPEKEEKRGTLQSITSSSNDRLALSRRVYEKSTTWTTI